MKLLACLLLAVSAFGQNGIIKVPQIRPGQVKTPIVSAPTVLVLLPSAPAVYAQLDPAMFWLDNTTTPPTLRVKMPTISYNAPLSFVLERNPDLTFTLPPIADGKYWTLSRNGVGQWNGIQYTVTGNAVRFTDPEQCCEADELITLTVWR